ncbi:MAG: phosphoenolpyruvate synthase [Crenarchaeota archaeon]|nr:phosphoenolpyruvate synthase [Thermoproteota archaeon]
MYRPVVGESTLVTSFRFVKWLEEVDKTMRERVGGKAANLGEMLKIGIPVPPGFVVTADAYKYFIEKSGIKDKIFQILREEIKNKTPEEYENASKKLRELIESHPMPPEIESEIRAAYRELCRRVGIEDVPVAVRSSATAEDIPEASFAGQQDTYLNVRGEDQVVYYVKKIWSSLFTARAIAYRDSHGIPHDKTFMSVVVQKLVNARSAGVMFTLHPITGDRDKIVIEAAWGLGEGIVSGMVTPDEFVIDKRTLRILEKRINTKKVAVVRDEKGLTKVVELPPEKANAPAITDEEAIKLAEYGIKLEQHYNNPMDIEWVIDADLQFPNNIFIVQARYETYWSRKAAEAKREEKPVTAAEAKIVAKGVPASPGVAVGRAKICLTIEEAEKKMQPGDILVTKMTNPDWVPFMKIASAIVTDEGGMTSHAAIVSRELGIPAVVGTGNATQVMKDGQVYTVDGSRGVVYEGAVKMEEEKKEAAPAVGVAPKEIIIHIYRSVRTGTGVYMNLGVPEKIHEYKDLPFDGIGLMRIEFTISSVIKEHPLYLISIGKEDKFVNLLAEAIAQVASAIYPRPVIVRFSDFKSNEYRQLTGGEKFEPEERNPMLGWRGVSRYISPMYEKAFRLELRAVKKVRDEMGLKNVHVMVPFVRAPWELKAFNKMLEEEGLVRGRDFKVIAMAEVPSIAILVEEFAPYVDGFSIGSNDLTQLIMGVDRDNEILVRENPRYFDERELPVLKAMYEIIRKAHKFGKTVGICGQAPSVYPDIVEFLVRAGIDYVSVNPDAVIPTRLLIASIEKKIMLEKLSEISAMLRFGKKELGETEEYELFKDIVFRLYGGKY